MKRRVLVLVAAGFVVAALGFLYHYFWVARPIGSGPAGPKLSRESFARPWTTHPVFVVGLGDSVTAGFGARRGYSYFDRLVLNPADEQPDMAGICLSSVLPQLQVTNLAVSGSASMELVESQLPRLPRVEPPTIGLVVITTGGNDLIHNYGRTPPREHAMYGADWETAKPWMENFRRRLEKIISELEARFPAGCQIFIANIYDPTDGIGDIEKAGLPRWPDGMKVLAAYNSVISQCAQKHPHVHMVNQHHLFLGHGIHCTQFWSPHYDSKDPHYWYYENLEDPNERGYDALRRLFLREIAKITDDFP